MAEIQLLEELIRSGNQQINQWIDGIEKRIDGLEKQSKDIF